VIRAADAVQMTATDSLQVACGRDFAGGAIRMPAAGSDFSDRAAHSVLRKNLGAEQRAAFQEIKQYSEMRKAFRKPLLYIR
jgi:hypothetical protein